MNMYELVYIIDTAVEEEARKELISRFNATIEANGGKVEKVEEWGKRRLAYPINFKNEGYYVLVGFSAGSELPKEIERNLQISDNVLRYQVIKLEEKRSNVKPRPVRVMQAPAEGTAPVAAPVAAMPATLAQDPSDDEPAPANAEDENLVE